MTTGLTMKSVFKDLVGKSIVYGLGSSLNGLAGFILIPFFMKRLTAAEYGRYALAEMLLNLLLVVLGMGMNVALLSRYQRLTAEERAELMGSVVSLMVISTIVIELVFLGVMQIAGGIIAPGIGNRLLLLVSAASTLETFWLIYATQYRAEGAAWRFIAGSLIQVCGGLAATVTLIVKFGFHEEGILYGRLVGDTAVLLYLLPSYFGCPPRLNLKPALNLLRVGIPLVPAALATMWVVMSPRYFVEQFGTVADVGVFAMSSRIAGLLSILFVQPFSMAWMVAIFKVHQRPDAQKVYARVLTYYVLVGGTLAVLLAAMSPEIVRVLGKDNFPLSHSTITVVALANVAAGLMYPLNIGPYVTESTRRVLPVFFTSTVLSVVCGGVFTKMWGVSGAALSLLLVYAVQSALLSIISDRLYPISKEWKRIIKSVLAISISYAIMQCASEYFGLEFWAAALLFPGSVLALLVMAGFFEQHEVQVLRSIIGRQT